MTLHDASDLWGKHVHETIKILQERYGGEKDLSVITIGPAGENLVKFACWMNENDRSSGRGGTGCVGGSKNLKAIVIRGKHADRPRPADQRGLQGGAEGGAGAALGRAGHHLAAQGRAVGLRHQRADEHHQRHRRAAGPQRPGDLLRRARRAAQRRARQEPRSWSNDPTCHACPVACKKEVEVKEGPFKVHMESVEYEPAWSLGAICGNDDIAAVAYMIDRANDYGFDAIEIGTVLAMYMEYTQKGYANGDGLAWGDTHGMVEMVRKIAFREGVGDILAEGTGKAAKKLGHPELAMACQGSGHPGLRPARHQGHGHRLCHLATAARATCAATRRPPRSSATCSAPPTVVDPLAWEGKGNLIMIFQNVHAMTDCLDVCKFATFSESLDGFAAQFAAITGAPCTADDLLKVGERVYNLERYYNNLNGFREGTTPCPSAS